MRISEEIAKFSKNLITAASDLVLFKIYLGVDWKMVGESPKEELAGEWQGLGEAFPTIPELTPPKILRALRFLLRQGYIEIVPHEDHLIPQITEEGGRRLDAIFPVYQKERPWDQKFYLVTYDIPVGKNAKRDALRNFLKDELGCVMLQSSVWLTPYNPVKSLNKFVERKKLDERVVVSVLLDEWAFGGRSVAEVLNEIYGLEGTNRRYQGFLEEMGERGEQEERGDKMEMAFEYFSVLRDDPQLPFELLPADWAGAAAQEVFEGLFFGK